jgi:predicted permease
VNQVATTFVQLIPVAVLVVAGWWLARRKIIAGDTSKPLCDLAFLLLIPSYLFPELYTSNLGQLFDFAAVGVYCATALTGMVIVSASCLFLARLGSAGAALRMMAACQVNTAYVAIPVFIQVFGDATPIFPILVLQACVLTVVVLAILESAEHRHRSVHPVVSLARSVGAALATPVAVSCLTAMALNALSWPVPEFALAGLSFIGAAASPVALIALGLHLGSSTLRLRGATSDENAIIAFKCVVLPLMVFGAAEYIVDIGDPWVAYLTVLAAMPAPQNVFILAGRYGLDLDFAGSVVVKTTVVSLLLLPAWMLLVA